MDVNSKNALFYRQDKRKGLTGLEDAGLIWHPKEGVYFDYNVNSYCHFRRTFEIDEVLEKAVIKIFADTRYMLYVNGTYISRGPCRSDPRWQYYDELDITGHLKNGKNVIAVLCLYYGYGTGQSISVMQGLWTITDIFLDKKGVSQKLYSDGNWKCRLSEAYDRTAPRVNARQGAMEVFDARKALYGWTEVEYNENDWESAIEIRPAKNTTPYWNKIPRSIPMLLEEEVEAAGITGVGEVSEEFFAVNKMDLGLIEELKSYRTISTYIPAINGQYLVGKSTPGKSPVLTYDMGKIIPGYLQLEVEGKAGDIIDVVYAEELWQGRALLDKLNRPADRFILKEGSNKFEITFGWKAFRYVQLIVRNPLGELLVKKVGMRVRRYPVQELGTFITKDTLLNQIWELSKHTLKICMQDGFMDSPSREQQQWMGDTRWQAIFNYYLSGDSRLHRKLLEQLGQSQDYEGMIRARYPDGHNNIMPIPHFCFSWISSFHDYYLYTGDDSMYRVWWPNILLALRWFTAFENEEGLLTDVPYWMFIDWSEKPLVMDVDRGGIITTLNIMYAEALGIAAKIASRLGDQQAETAFTANWEKLTDSIRTKLWNQDRGAYADCMVDGILSKTVSEAANSLAILHLHEVTDLRVESIMRNVFSMEARGKVARTSPYLLVAVERALIKLGKAEIVLDIIRERYEKMLLAGATATWEEWHLFKTQDDREEGILSASHGWGANPIMFFMEGLLGIKILEPGFKKVQIKPDPCGLKEIHGEIPTPLGKLAVHVTMVNEDYSVDIKAPDAMEIQFLDNLIPGKKL